MHQPVKKIDMHVHCVPELDLPRINGTNYPLPENLRQMYNQIGIDCGVLMAPGSAPEGTYDRISQREAFHLYNDNRDVFISWFCNLDPRQGKNSPETDFTHYLSYYKAKGASGVGEMTANVYLDDPRIMNLFYHCEINEMPVLIHLGTKGNDYGVVDEGGLPRLEKVLKTFPNLIIIGHSPRFWNEFGPDSRVENLMKEYPNLWIEFSSLAGGNAILRDENYTCCFFERHSDRILYGTDFHEPNNLKTYDIYQKIVDFMERIAIKEQISEDTYRKICRQNALRLLRVKEEE